MCIESSVPFISSNDFVVCIKVLPSYLPMVDRFLPCVAGAENNRVIIEVFIKGQNKDTGTEINGQ